MCQDAGFVIICRIDALVKITPNGMKKQQIEKTFTIEEARAYSKKLIKKFFAEKTAVTPKNKTSN